MNGFIQNYRKKATPMKKVTTLGDAFNFVKWLFDFVQMIFGWFSKKDEETGAEAEA